MSTKRRLRDRVISFVLACVMLCSLFMVDGVIPEAEALLITNSVMQQLDEIPIHAGKQRVRETYTYKFSIWMDVVDESGTSILYGDNVKIEHGSAITPPVEDATIFTATFSNYRNADIKPIQNPNGNGEIETEYHELEDTLVLKNMFSQERIEEICGKAAAIAQANPGRYPNGVPAFDKIFDTTGLSGSEEEQDAALYANFMAGPGKYFRKIVQVQMLSVETDENSDLAETWDATDLMSMIFSMNCRAKGTVIANSVRKTKPDDFNPNGCDFDSQMKLYVEKLDVTVTGAWPMNSGTLLELFPTYAAEPFQGMKYFADRSLYNRTLFHFDTCSEILADKGSLRPAQNANFKPVAGLEGWDGFLPYKLVIKDLNKAYNSINGFPKDAVKNILLANQTNPPSGLSDYRVTDADANYIVETHNAETVCESLEIYKVESAPGLFYRIHIDNPGATYDEGEEAELIRNITTEYNEATDEYTINYELRSTNNHVAFLFFPVKFNANDDKLHSIVPLNFGPGADKNTGDRYYSYIYNLVDFNVSIMGFPAGVTNVKANNRDARIAYSAGYNGNLFASIDWYETKKEEGKEVQFSDLPNALVSIDKPETGYFHDIATSYAYDCIGGPSSSILPYKTSATFTAPDVSASPGVAFCLARNSLGYTAEDADTIYRQDGATTPKLTYGGKMMDGHTGYPSVTMIFWDEINDESIPPDPETGTVVLDWNMQGFPAMELQDESTEGSVGEINGTGDGGFGKIVRGHIKAGDNLVFDSRYQRGLTLLIPDLPVGADIPYNKLKPVLLAQVGGSEDKIISADKYAQMPPIKNCYCYRFKVPYNGPRNSDHGWQKDREHGRISKSTERGKEPWHEQRTARSSKQN